MTKKAKKVVSKRTYRKRVVKKPAATPQPLSFGWRPHMAGVVRVWRSDWFGDQFELMTEKDFADLRRVCKRFSIVLNQADEDSD